MSMGFCPKFARWFLVAMNTIFILAGLALFIVGCILRFGLHILVGKYLEPLLKQATMGRVSSIDLSSLVNGFAIALIIIGVVVVAIGTLGCCGACCLIRVMLTVYGVSVFVLLIAQVVCIALFFIRRKEIDTAFKDHLKKNLVDEYTGELGKSAMTLAWNFAFLELRCCGVDDYRDLHAAQKWKRTYAVPGSGVIKLATPVTCCKLKGSFPNYKMPKDKSCAVTPTDSNSNYKHGCFDKLEELIVSKSDILIAVCVVVFIFETIVILCSYFLCRAHKENKNGCV